MSDDPLVPYFAWDLAHMLMTLERGKGAPLTEQEVLDARGKAPVIAIPTSKRDAIFAKRGYSDLDPANLWEEWQQYRLQPAADGGIEDTNSPEDQVQ